MKWTSRHTKILILTHKDTPTEEIASAVGMSVAGINSIRTKPLFNQKLEALYDKATSKVLEDTKEDLDHLVQAREALNKKATWAAKQVIKLAKKGTSKDRLKLDAARDILDRAGLKPKEVIETRSRDYSPEEINSALATMKELEHITKQLTQGSGSRFLLDTTKPTNLVTDSPKQIGVDDTAEETKQTSQDRPSPLST